MRWSRSILILLMLLDVWYRAHTFGGHVRDGLGISLWPRSVGASEPLDCDEAAYAYIGHRVLHGDVLYRDLTENKPPLGYWIYTLAVALGGYNELTIRVMPIPYVLARLPWFGGLRIGWAVGDRAAWPPVSSSCSARIPTCSATARTSSTSSISSRSRRWHSSCFSGTAPTGGFW